MKNSFLLNRQLSRIFCVVIVLILVIVTYGRANGAENKIDLSGLYSCKISLNVGTTWAVVGSPELSRDHDIGLSWEVKGRFKGKKFEYKKAPAWEQTEPAVDIELEMTVILDDSGKNIKSFRVHAARVHTPQGDYEYSDFAGSDIQRVKSPHGTLRYEQRGVEMLGTLTQKSFFIDYARTDKNFSNATKWGERVIDWLINKNSYLVIEIRRTASLYFLGAEESEFIDFRWNFSRRLPFGVTVIAGEFEGNFPHIYLTLSGPLAEAYKSSSGAQRHLRFESDEEYSPLGEFPAWIRDKDYYGDTPYGERYVPVDMRKGISLENPQDKRHWPRPNEGKWISHWLDYSKLWDLYWNTVKPGVSSDDEALNNLADLRGTLKAIAYRIEDKPGKTSALPEIKVFEEVEKEIKLTHVAEVTEINPGYIQLIGKPQRSKGIRIYSKRKGDKKYYELTQRYSLDDNLQLSSWKGISPKNQFLEEPLELLPGDVVRLGKYDAVRLRMLFDDPFLEWYVKGRKDVLGLKEMGQIIVYPRGGEPTIELLKRWAPKSIAAVLGTGVGYVFGTKTLTTALGGWAGPVGGIIGFALGEFAVWGVEATAPSQIEWEKVKWLRYKDLQSIMAGDVGYKEARIYAISGKATFEDLDGKEVAIKEGQMLKVGGPSHFMVETYDEKSLPPHVKSVVEEYRKSSEGGETVELAATPPAEPEEPSPAVSPQTKKPGREIIPASQIPSGKAKPLGRSTEPKPSIPSSEPNGPVTTVAKLPPGKVEAVESPTKPKTSEVQAPTVPWPQREVVQHFDNGSIDWSKGTVTALGVGAPPPNAVNVAQARIMARRAAIVVARRNLLEIIQGVRIDSMTLVKEAIVQSDIIRTSIQGVVRNAQILDTDYMSDGSVEVKVAMNMSGQLANTILPQHSPAVPWATGPSVVAVTPETLKPSSDIITGLVVDARGLGARPAMSPKIVDETGKEIYGSAMVNRQYAVQQGMAGYTRDLSTAQSTSRVTANPLTVKGLRSVGPGKSDIVISNSDASRILSAAENLLFMQKCRVMIVVD